MTIDVNTLSVTNNRAQNRFEVALGDSIGELTYRKNGSVYFLVHTGVPPEFRGQGIATRLVHGALEQIKAEDGKIIALCPFVRDYLRQNPEYQSLLAIDRS